MAISNSHKYVFVLLVVCCVGCDREIRVESLMDPKNQLKLIGLGLGLGAGPEDVHDAISTGSVISETSDGATFNWLMVVSKKVNDSQWKQVAERMATGKSTAGIAAPEFCRASTQNLFTSKTSIIPSWHLSDAAPIAIALPAEMYLAEWYVTDTPSRAEAIEMFTEMPQSDLLWVLYQDGSVGKESVSSLRTSIVLP